MQIVGCFFFYTCELIFWKLIASPPRGQNRARNRPRTGDATAERSAEKKWRKIQ